MWICVMTISEHLYPWDISKTWNLSFFLDCLLRGEKLQGPLVWVHQRLLRDCLSPEPMQLLQGGEREVCGLWPAQLHGAAVPPDQGRVPRVSEHHRLQWLHSVLPHCPCGKYKYDIINSGETSGQTCLTVHVSPVKMSCAFPCPVQRYFQSSLAVAFESKTTW